MLAKTEAIPINPQVVGRCLRSANMEDSIFKLFTYDKSRLDYKLWKRDDLETEYNLVLDKLKQSIESNRGTLSDNFLDNISYFSFLGGKYPSPFLTLDELGDAAEGEEHRSRQTVMKIMIRNVRTLRMCKGQLTRFSHQINEGYNRAFTLAWADISGTSDEDKEEFEKTFKSIYKGEFD